jgi:hypothetical protein
MRLTASFVSWKDERLRSEGERVNREIEDYADLARATITSMRAISGSIRECKLAQDQPM